MIQLISNCEFLLANRKPEPQNPFAKVQHFQGFVGEEDTSNSCIALYKKKKTGPLRLPTTILVPNCPTLPCTFKRYLVPENDNIFFNCNIMSSVFQLRRIDLHTHRLINRKNRKTRNNNHVGPSCNHVSKKL